MNYEIGNCVTCKTNTHKKIIAIKGSIVTLEFYTEVGREIEDVPLLKDGKSNINLISHKESKQFQEMRLLFMNGQKSFHFERERRSKRRVELAKKSEFNRNKKIT